MKYPRCILVALFALAVVPAFSPAAEKGSGARKNAPLTVADIQRTAPVDFEKDVLPALSTSCMACHNKTKAKSGLVLETPADIKKGSDDGAVVVPGKGIQSLLFKAAVHAAGVENPMPPPGNKVAAPDLTPGQLALLKLWIDQGAAGEVRGLQAPVAWQTMPATLDPIFAVAVTNDGRFAACGRANRIDVYDLPAGKLAAHLVDPQLATAGSGSAGADAAHHDMVESLAFSPDGSLLASGSYREIKFWRRAFAGEKISFGSKPITCLVSTADGSLVAGADADGVIHLWDAAGKETGKLEGHSAAVASLRFSPDGKQLLSGSKDKTVQVWDVAGRKSFCHVEVPAEVKSVGWVGPKAVAAGAADGIVRVWKLPAAAEGAMTANAKTFKEGTSPAIAIEPIAGDEVHFFYGTEDGIVRRASADSGSLKIAVRHGGPMTAMALRPDGKRLITAGIDGAARIWSVDDGKQIAEMKGDPAAVARSGIADRALALAKGEITYRKGRVDAADKQAKASAERAQKAKDGLAPAEKALVEAKKAFDEAKAARAALDVKEEKKSDEKKPADAAEDKKSDAKANAKKAEKETAEAAKAAQVKADKIAALDEALKKAEDGFKKADGSRSAIEDEIKLSAKGVEESNAQLAAAKEAAQAAQDAQKLRDKEAVEAKKAIAESAKPIRAISLLADGSLLATAGDDGAVRTWSAEKGTASVSFPVGGTIAAVAFTGSGRVIACPADSAPTAYSSATIWKLERTLSPADSQSLFADRVTSLDFSADGRLLVSGGGVPSRSGEIRVFDVASGTLKQSLDNVHSDTVFSVRFSPDGKRLASAGADRFVREVDLATGKTLLSLEGHTGHALAVAWSHDGHTLVSGGADNNLRFWDAESGERGKVIAGFDKEVTGVCYVGDDNQAVATSGDGKVRLVRDNGGDVRAFTGPTDFVYGVAVTPDGSTIVAGGQDGILRAWDSNNVQPTGMFSVVAEKK